MTRIIPTQIPHEVPASASSTATDKDYDKDNNKSFRIDADLLIPGRGEAVQNATLIYTLTSDRDGAHGEILFAGKTSHLPSKYSSLKAEHKVPVLMPGLWDCHTHFFGQSDAGSLDKLAELKPSLAGFRCARDAMRLLDAGFTSVREVGGYGMDFSQAIDEGWIPGPNIYSAAAPLSQTAGHGDLHSVHEDHLHDLIHHGLPLCVVDGVEEAIKGTRQQIRRGAKCIKICSTGGVMSRIDSPRAAQFTNKELEAIVEEARRTGLAVASHAHGTEGIIAAINAGVTSIEHGSYLTKEAIDLMIEKNVMLVATRAIVEWGVENSKAMDPINYKKLLEVADNNFRSYKAAIKAGVKCALGTDLGQSNEEFGWYHGLNGREFVCAVKAGMTEMQAIECGTANAPDTLGPQAPKSGQLKDGFDADFIALETNPLDDITVLTRPQDISHVWKGGVLVKKPGKGVRLW